MNIQDYFKYSWFSTLAYVDWKPGSINNANPSAAIQDANAAERIPGDTTDAIVNTLGEKIFSPTTDGGEGWQVANFQPNDAAGFAASLFVKAGTNEKVLAIRGTEPGTLESFTTDLLNADLHEIGEYGMAISQAVSLFNYVQSLKAPIGSQALQLNLRITSTPPTLGTAYVETETRFSPGPFLPDIVTPVYIWVEPGATKPGLGLISETDNLAITGHSLGGHLAAAALRMFPTLFDTSNYRGQSHLTF